MEDKGNCELIAIKSFNKGKKIDEVSYYISKTKNERIKKYLSGYYFKINPPTYKKYLKYKKKYLKLKNL